MNYVRLSDDGPEYPYNLWQLRLANPNVSFSNDPSAEDLAPFNCYFVFPTPQPDHDPRLEAIEQATPVQGPDGWVQAWTIRPTTPEEQANYDAAHRPAPDWGAFKQHALNSSTLNAILAEAFSEAPVAASSLAPALLRAESYGPEDFGAAWSAICAAVPAALEAATGFQQLAMAYHLPADFVAALQPASPALTRARNSDGTFLPDDPATPNVNEAWTSK